MSRLTSKDYSSMTLFVIYMWLATGYVMLAVYHIPH